MSGQGDIIDRANEAVRWNYFYAGLILGFIAGGLAMIVMMRMI